MSNIITNNMKQNLIPHKACLEEALYKWFLRAQEAKVENFDNLMAKRGEITPNIQ